AVGVATGCAISGKYLGACMLAIVVPVFWGAPGTGRGTHASVAAAAMLATLVVANLPAIMHLGAVSQSFDREMKLAVSGQSGATRNVPHALYWNVFRDNTTPVVWVLLAAFLF